MAEGKQPATIDIFLRIRPVRNPSSNLLIEPNEGKIEFKVPKDLSSGCVELAVPAPAGCGL